MTPHPRAFCTFVLEDQEWHPDFGPRVCGRTENVLPHPDPERSYREPLCKGHHAIVLATIAEARRREKEELRNERRRRAPHRRCPLRCPCICHDTGGSGHDHPGQPCPGKFITGVERDVLNLLGRG